MSEWPGKPANANGGDNSPPRTPPRHKRRAYKAGESHQHRNHPNGQQPEAECFSAKRANDITLEQIKKETKWPSTAPTAQQGDATAGDTDAVQLETGIGEGDLLLQGSRQQQQQQQQQQQWPRVNFTMGQGDESQPLNIQKFPEEIQLQQGNNKSPTDNIMATKSLSAMTTTTTTTTTTATANTTPRASSSPDAHTHDEHNAPKFWLYLKQHWLSISELLGLLVVSIVVWMLAYVLQPDQVEPNSAIMRLVFLFIGAQLSGILVTFIRLPDMLGMLFFGVIYTNVGLADFSQVKGLEVFLRKMALINIMLLAGLGLDGKAFRKLWTMILRLTLVPTVAEVTVIAVLSRYMLNMPWLWGILLGLVITAVSPNVVVTVMLKLKEERLGLNKGIHTLIYAMTSCNDVVAIFLFGVISGVIFSQGTLTEQILQGPIGVGIGVVFGYVYGLMLQFVPSKNSAYRNGQRLVLCLLGGTISVLGSEAIGYPSAGALGCMTIAFVAGIGWKRQYEKLSQHEQSIEANSNAAKRLDLLWKFLKPVSFALIGKEIHFTVLNGEVVGYGILLVLLGSLFRLGFAYISTYGGQLTTKERAYITISGFPKATVQAALGPIALDLAHTYQADEATVALASRVLIISVLAIIFTAPLGAILMLRLAPHWLERSVGDLPTTTSVGSRRNGGAPGQDLDSVASGEATESGQNHSHGLSTPAADTTRQRYVVANGVELSVVPMEPESVLPMRRDDRADDERSRP